MLYTDNDKNKKITKLDYAELNLASEEEEPEGGPDLEKIIAKLDEDHRVIIVLRFFEGMKLAEIAKVLDINENTVKTKEIIASCIWKVGGGTEWVILFAQTSITMR